MPCRGARDKEADDDHDEFRCTRKGSCDCRSSSCRQPWSRKKNSLRQCGIDRASEKHCISRGLETCGRPSWARWSPLRSIQANPDFEHAHTRNGTIERHADDDELLACPVHHMYAWMDGVSGEALNYHLYSLLQSCIASMYQSGLNCMSPLGDDDSADGSDDGGDTPTQLHIVGIVRARRSDDLSRP